MPSTHKGQLTKRELAKRLDSNIEEIEAILQPFSELLGIELCDELPNIALFTEPHQEDSLFFRWIDPDLTYGDRADLQSEKDVMNVLADRLMFSQHRLIDVWHYIKQTFVNSAPEITLVSVGCGLGQETYSFLILLNKSILSAESSGAELSDIQKGKVKVNAINYSKNLQNLVHINKGRMPISVFESSLLKSGDSAHVEQVKKYFRLEEKYAKFKFSLLQALEVSIKPIYADLETPQGIQLVEAQKGDYVFFCNIFHYLDSQYQDAALNSVRRSVKPNGYFISDKCEKGIEGIEGKLESNEVRSILEDIESFWKYHAPMGASIETGKGGGFFGSESCSELDETIRQHILSLRSSANKNKQDAFLKDLRRVRDHLSTTPRGMYYGTKQLIDKINTYLVFV